MELRREIQLVVFILMQKLKSRTLALKRLFVRPLIPKNPNGKILIHLGCGNINSPEFINVDTKPAPHIHYIMDATDLSFFQDNYADLVYACHILEHVPEKNILKVLYEWKRILKPGGVLRISVPDLDKLIEIYERCSRDISSIRSPLMGTYDGYKTHCAIFNHKYLSQILSNLGFKEVREWDPDKVEHHNFEDWASKCIEYNGKRFHISLNLEAVK